jgi:hypothetical protein
MTLTPSEPPVTDPHHFPEPDPEEVVQDMPGVDPDWPQTVRDPTTPPDPTTAQESPTEDRPPA